MKVIPETRRAQNSVPDEGYSRNTSCALNLISTFLLHVSYSFSESSLFYSVYNVIQFQPVFIEIMNNVSF